MESQQNPIDVKKDVKGLIEMKDAIEKEISDLFEYLQTNNVGMEEPLVDKDGYPRADLDVASVRTVRHKIICLRNDLKDVVRSIEEGLHTLHALEKPPGLPQPTAAGRETAPNSTHRTSNEPFLTVDQVFDASPAKDAGMKVGDSVVQFGSLCADNFDALAQVADIVQNSIAKPLRLTVLRDGHPVRMTITPGKWSGNGLLGCHIVPLTKKKRTA